MVVLVVDNVLVVVVVVVIVLVVVAVVPKLRNPINNPTRILPNIHTRICLSRTPPHPEKKKHHNNKQKGANQAKRQAKTVENGKKPNNSKQKQTPSIPASTKPGHQSLSVLGDFLAFRICMSRLEGLRSCR